MGSLLTVFPPFLDPVGELVEGQIHGWPRWQVGQGFRLGRNNLHSDGAIFPVVIE